MEQEVNETPVTLAAQEIVVQTDEQYLIAIASLSQLLTRVSEAFVIIENLGRVISEYEAFRGIENNEVSN